MITASNSTALTTEPFQNKGALKIVAQFFSYLLHPIFIPVYVMLFLIYVHPVYFAGFSPKQQAQTMVIIILNLVFFPLLAVFLLKALGFISSIFLKNQKDRIIPYIACGIFYFWSYTVFKEQTIYPPVVPSFILGIFLASSGALIANIYFKISMHTIGMGGWLGLFILIAFSGSMLMSWPLALVILLTGLIGSARLGLQAHNNVEVYAGFFLGLLAQLAAYLVVGGF